MTYQGPWDADYIEAQYERWKKDPAGVEKDWQAFFRGFELAMVSGPGTGDVARKQSRVEALIYRYRDIGHLLACLDPLAACPTSHPLLEPDAFGLDSGDMDRAFYFRGFPAEERTMPLSDIIARLRRVYCGDAGVEYMHLQDPEERAWLRERMEGQETPADAEEKKRILRKLVEASAFEEYIHRRYLGQKRFSAEGAETMIPMLDCAVRQAADHHGCGRIVMGMAHRGRLNVQVNVLNKPYEDIFRAFEDQHDPEADVGGGDVKYHSGFDGIVETGTGKRVSVIMAHNPSHLESVDPVIAGMTRAYRETDESGGTLSLVLHGDAAFAGQGIVAETLNMSQLEGYGVGGTIHLVINNQIGYTALPDDLRSTRYATDVAKMLMVPIFHVHGESPEAAVRIMKLAVDYRMQFAKDVVIDLVCYRRHGHNEGDEPYFTQPLMYERIKDRPVVHALYYDRLREEGSANEKDYEAMRSGVDECLREAHDKAVKEKPKTGVENQTSRDKEQAEDVPASGTAVDSRRLRDIAKTINTVPENFVLHRKLKRLFDGRLEAVETGKGIDWANAESLAFASILKDKTSIRLSGQDSRRGTFSQRHAVVFEANTADTYVPADSVSAGNARFAPINSLLSEAGVLGFEYGYSLVNRKALTIWEAQFGDFANNAQAVIDLYVAAGEYRWGRKSALVMLLPHGYEGQGPDHSSARIERFLQLAADGNIHVCIPTTPAQYFHLLRLQAARAATKPLVVMTPKSLLRNPAAVSRIEDFSDGAFRDVIDDPESPGSPEKVVLVSGKLYYELEQAREESGREGIVLIRVERLHPFPETALETIRDRYDACDNWAWAQEEPENMGVWRYMDPLFHKAFGRRLEYIGRPAAASPATGYHRVFQDEQTALVSRIME